MKMTTKIIAVLLTVISTVTFANTNDSTQRDALVRVVTGSANGSYKLIYQGDEGQVKFKLINEKGNVLHDEYLRIEHGFIQPVNLSNMPSGDYTFIVENKSETLFEAVSYTSVSDLLAKKIRFDQVAHQLEFIGNDLEQNLKIQIYNDLSELIYSDKITTGNVDQIFDFGHLRSNWVSFVILNENGVLSDQMFNLR